LRVFSAFHEGIGAKEVDWARGIRKWRGEKGKGRVDNCSLEMISFETGIVMSKAFSGVVGFL
jgi:hypothetical protein